VLPIHFSGHGLRYWYPLRALAHHVRTFRPQVIYVEEEPGSLALTQLAFLKGRAKLICFTWENIMRRVGIPGIERCNLACCDGIIAGNREAASLIRRKGFAKPLTVTPQLGIDPNLFSPRTKSASAKFIVGYLGRLVEEKGVRTLLEAIVKVPDASVLLIGSGPLRDEIAQWVSANRLTERVTQIPAVSHEEIPRYLQSMDVLVLPSLTTPTWKEQFGHVLIEAMACGVPVIGSDSGAIPEVIGDAGIIVPERKVDALRDALARLIAQPTQREHLAHAGRARVLAHFTHEHIAKANVAFFQEVLAA
jgi:glycosyltransferase involved in cell wall biosynthesis